MRMFNSKTTAALFAALLLSFGIIISCENASSDNAAMMVAVMQANAQKKAQASKEANAKKIVKFTGSVSSSGGAYSAQMSAVSALANMSASGVSKSAAPGLDTSDTGNYEWFATATASGAASVQGEFTDAANRRVFTMALEIGKSWKITCGIRNKATSVVALEDKFTFEASEDNPVFSHTFTPVPATGGKGGIALIINVDDKVARATAYCVDKDGKSVEKVLSVTGSSGNKTATFLASDVASGLYDVTFTFFGGNETDGWYYLYSVSQGVNVFNGATTDTWQAGSTGKVETDAEGKTALVVDSEEIASYAPSVLYVGKTSSAGATGAKNPSDSNSGNAYEPLATIGRAVQIIKQTLPSSPSSKLKDYKIYVSGTVESAKSEDNADFGDAFNGKAMSLTICGLGSADVIDAKSKGIAVKVDTTVPLTIKNVKITGGINSSGYGGGLLMKSGSNVTLGSGVKITGNSAYSCGAGVYNDSGTLHIKGAVISNNVITGNDDGCGGIGLYATGSATISMSAGQISGNQNTASTFVKGGGVRLEGDSVEFNLSGGKITANSVKNVAGNIYANGSTINMTGGEISDGSAGVAGVGGEGGGLYLDGTSKLNMSGGTIRDNGLGDMGGSGGGVFVKTTATFKISGTARVPCGLDGQGNPAVGKNDVWLERTGSGLSAVQASIKVAGDITGESGLVAAITPQGWTRSSVVLTADTAIITASTVNRFGITDSGFNINKDSTSKLGMLTAPIYVAGLDESVAGDKKGINYFVCDKGGSDADGVTGTKNSPFATIEKALTAIESLKENITIDGTVLGTSLIPSTFNTSGTELTIMGASGNNKDKLTLQNGATGTVLKVESPSSVSVTIQRLKITGGKGAEKGGGIYMASGSNVTLASGALVGDSTAPSSAATGTSDCGNSAKSGGGVYVDGGTLTLKSGSYINHNWAVEGTTYPDGGGGIFVSATGKVVMQDGAQIIKNGADQDGGGICILEGGQVSMTGGLITGNVAGADGGAVSNSGTFEMSGNAYIPCSGEKQNDVRLATGKTITIADNLTAPSGGAKNATITPANWKKRDSTVVLDQSKAGLVAGNYARFTTTDSGEDCFSIKLNSDTSPTQGILDAPIIVAAISGTYNANAAHGTASKPYKTISDAIQHSVSASCATVTIKGSVPKQTVSWPASGSGSAALSVTDITVAGKNTSAKIDAGGTSGAGSALTVSAEGKTVIVKTLLITGGRAENGGGINVAAGAVKLADGAKIYGNRATANGGGVYLAGNKSRLIVTKTALIGNDTTTNKSPNADVLITEETTEETVIKAANSAARGGGIYSAGGDIYIGCNTIGSATTGDDGYALADGYGVRQNYSVKGGGISVGGSSGKLIVASGSVSYNSAATNCGGGIYATGCYTSDTSYSITINGGSVEGNYAATGGGAVYLAGEGASKIAKLNVTGGTFKSNESGESGGALDLAAHSQVDISGTSPNFTSNTAKGGEGGGFAHIGSDATLTISGGTITFNEAKNSANGGAIYQGGTLNLKSNAYIPCPGVKQNDIYLPDGKYITPDGLNTATGAPATVATIMPSAWTRGKQVLDGTSVVSYAGKFKTTDTDFTVNAKGEDSSAIGIIKADIFVASATKATRKHCSQTATATDSASTAGTVSAPFATIQGAITYGVNEDATTITLDGTLTAQSIDSWPTGASGVSAITIKGWKKAATTTTPNPTSDAKIDASSSASALKINVAKEFTIEDLQITKGSAYDGGGINVNKAGATVNLGDKAKVFSNKVTATSSITPRGAGVFVTTGATLNILEGSEIYSNTATVNGTYGAYGGGVLSWGTVKMTGGKIYGNSAEKGGGIWSGGTLYVLGKAIVGDDTETPATATLRSNYASQSGGGIYVNDGSLYLGCNESGTAAEGYKLDEGCGVRRNGASSGGGIYVTSSATFKAASGCVSYNYAANGGGGIYASGSTNSINGALKFVSNQSKTYGGALLVVNSGAKKVTISGAAEFTGNSVTTDGSSAVKGGAVYIYTGAALEITSDVKMNSNDATVTTKSGDATSGSASAYGGAIYNDGTLTMTAGTIGGSDKLNTASKSTNASSAAYGGAIYNNGTFNISGSAVVYSGTGVAERSNDVCLASGKSVKIAANNLSQTTVAAITPVAGARGTKIIDTSGISSLTETQLNTIKGKFNLTQSGWDKVNLQESSKWTGVTIRAPIYVVGASGTSSTKPDETWGWGDTAANGATGSKTRPYSSIAEAAAATDLDKATEPNTITVVGTLCGAMQEISSPSADITIKGWKAAGVEKSDAKIQRFASKPSSSQTNGSVLSISASGKTVTITDLTLTYGAAGYGAGINLSAGTLKLGDYAKITGNAAGNSGGGVLVDTGATLFMYGKALIGDKLSTDTGITTATGKNDCANSASEQGGAGIHNKGATYIGYNGFKADGTTPNPSAIDNGYGIIRNAAFKNEGGGGIKNNGTLLIGSGSISYNYANTAGGGVNCNADAIISGGTFVSNNSGGSGGAIHVSSSKTVTIDGGATFTKNIAKTQGGAICNWGTLNMSAGTIGGSDAEDANTVTNDTGMGGAIFQNGTFNISGSAYIPAGSGERSNDVWLGSSKYITVAKNDLSNSPVAAITPYAWARKTTVLAKGTGAGAPTSITEAIAGKFAASEKYWSVVSHANVGKLDSDFWVCPGGAAMPGNSGGGSDKDEDAHDGTYSKPYATIKKAVENTWCSTTTINVFGSYSYPNNTLLQQIPNSGEATTINLVGWSRSGSELVSGGAEIGGVTVETNAGGSAFTINKAATVNITGITFTGGEITGGNGGGINIAAAATVKLYDCKVTGNKAIKNDSNAGGKGGGIYVGDSAKLLISGSSSSTYTEIFANEAQDGGGIYNDNNATLSICRGYIHNNKVSRWGGGVYNNCGNASGGCYFGLLSPTDYCSTVSENEAVTAGGGFYNQSGPLKIGWTYDFDTSSEKVSAFTDTSYCITKNKFTGSDGGGGVYNGGTLSMNSGVIGGSADYKNTAATDGAGICNKGTFEMTGGTISYNEAANNGGGVYNPGTFTMSGGKISYNKSQWGAGICNSGNTSNNTTISNGEICYNTANVSSSDGRGGGIYCFNGIIVLEGASGAQRAYIHDNSATKYGGAVYYSTNSRLSGDRYFKIGGYVYIPAGSSKKNGVYLDKPSSGQNPQSTPITITSNLSAHDTTTDKAIILEVNSNVGQILTGGADLVKNNYQKFKSASGSVVTTETGYKP